MVQALLNNINITNIPSSNRGSNVNAQNESNFDKLFEKQNLKTLNHNKNVNKFESKIKNNIKTKNNQDAHIKENNKYENTDKKETKFKFITNSKTSDIEEKNTETEKTKDSNNEVNNTDILSIEAEYLTDSEVKIEAEDETENIDESIEKEDKNTSEDENTAFLEVNLQNPNSIIILDYSQQENTESEQNTQSNNANILTSLSKNTENSTNNPISNILKNMEQVENPEENAVQLKTNTGAKEVSKDEILEEEVLEELNIESIENETENSNMDSSNDEMLNQGSSPQEQSLKATLQGDIEFSEIQNNIKTTTSNNQTTIKTTDKTEIASNRILEQISKQMDGMKNGSKVNIVLNPEALGKVSVQIVNTKDGLQAQFLVATQDAKNLIMKGLDGLKENLLAQGISIDNVTVKTNNTENEKYESDWTEQEGSRGGNKEQQQRKDERNKEQFEKTMFFIEQENGKV